MKVHFPQISEAKFRGGVLRQKKTKTSKNHQKNVKKLIFVENRKNVVKSPNICRIKFSTLDSVFFHNHFIGNIRVKKHVFKA